MQTGEQFEMVQIATPSGNPATGYTFLYIKADGKLYSKDSSGNETLIGPSASASGTFAMGTYEADLGSAWVDSGYFDMTGFSGLTIGKYVMVHQALGPYTNKGTLDDDIEFDSLVAAGIVISATTIRVHWRSVTGNVIGNFKFNYVIQP